MQARSLKIALALFQNKHACKYIGVIIVNKNTDLKLGKLAHYSFDLVLISIILAGINRNTGLQFDTSNLSSVDFRNWFGKYLSLGERLYDYTVSLLRSSGYFKQKNLVYDYVSKEAGKYLKQQTGRDIEDFKSK